MYRIIEPLTYVWGVVYGLLSTMLFLLTANAKVALAILHMLYITCDASGMLISTYQEVSLHHASATSCVCCQKEHPHPHVCVLS